MSHAVETMAYAGEVPWHGLGKQVLPDLTPDQMLVEAGLDWEVEKVPAFAMVAGEQVSVARSALVRTSDNTILDVVGEEWNPVQNAAAFNFFHDFVAAGNMEMHTAGSLFNGKRVWALARVKDEGFTLFGKDKVEQFLLFSNPHQYGRSIDIRFTGIRVVCNNTLTLSLSDFSKNKVRVSHRAIFDADEVKATMQIAGSRMTEYHEMATVVSKARYTEETKVEYLERLFPVLGEAKRKQRSKAATNVLSLLDTQPGAEMGEGTFWQLFNGATYYVDHEMGRNVDNRMNSAWFGSGANKKQEALELAVEMASAA